jgi:hypothetical protein
MSFALHVMVGPRKNVSKLSFSPATQTNKSGTTAAGTALSSKKN